MPPTKPCPDCKYVMVVDGRLQFVRWDLLKPCPRHR